MVKLGVSQQQLDGLNVLSLLDEPRRHRASATMRGTTPYTEGLFDILFLDDLLLRRKDLISHPRVALGFGHSHPCGNAFSHPVHALLVRQLECTSSSFSDLK
jgi:hypothetical protein